MSSGAAAKLVYDDTLESALGRIASLIGSDYYVSKRAIALLLLQGDPEVEKQVREREDAGYGPIQQVMAQTRAGYGQPLSSVIARRRQGETNRILSGAVTRRGEARRGFAERLSRAMMSPLTGVPILLVVLFALYGFVGVFGAGIGVDFIEGTVFGTWVNPWLSDITVAVIPWKFLQDLFVGEYGIFTLGLTYAFAIILPIVATFFIAFSIIEDSGYLPRLAMLIDRVFKRIGLNGRAVIPMVLGFGCDTMATMVTRTQETKRERVITTLLLALAIPCSAQLGVIFAILAGNSQGLLVWGGVMALVLLLVGYLAAKVIPGKRAAFYMEIPPLRRPRLGNVLTKTYTRMQWYFFEVLPLFIIASVIIWLGALTGVFDIIVRGFEPLVRFIGLPSETAVVFLFGFFRRDFGAAGLYDLHSAGVVVGVPLVVAAVTLTLFMPCIAQLMMTLRERGGKTTLAMVLFIFPFAFAVGFVLNSILTLLGVSL